MALLEVIKYEGDNNTFIWKHPCEDFNTTSQLIVHESQEAIFFMNGQALDLFGPGHYTLTSQNIPLIRKLINLPTAGETPFHCEVYFINKTEQMAIRWGTDSKVQYIDPIYNFPISIGASGELSLSVADSRKLLIKLVGTENILEREKLTTYFRALLMTKVKTYIAQEIKNNNINIFQIDERLEEFSEKLKVRLENDFLEYGVKLEKFYVTTIVKPDGDEQYEKFKELHFRQYADIAEAELKQKVGIIEQQTKSQQMIIESQGLAEKRRTEGYTYQQERGFDIAEGIANNEGAGGQLTNMGIGLGMMAAVGNTIGNTVNNAVTNSFEDVNINSNVTTNKFCENCGKSINITAAFCENCGTPQKLSEHCVGCGFIFKENEKFCPKCGTKRNG